jgi:two-component system response regulator
MNSFAKKNPNSSPSNASGLPRILLVEDDEDAVILIQRLLKRAGLLQPVDVAGDGEVALAYLQRCLATCTPLPSLVLLDLKLPRTNGFEVLARIKSTPALSSLRVVVMSSSSRPQDVSDARKLGADSYMEKYPPVSEMTTLFQWTQSLLLPEEVEYRFPPADCR